MIFKNFNDFYSDILKEIDKITYFENELYSITDLYDNFTTSFLDLLNEGELQSNNNSNTIFQSKINTRFNSLYSEFRKCNTEIDFFKLGSLSSEIISNIKKIDLICNINIINRFIDQLNLLPGIIHSYLCYNYNGMSEYECIKLIVSKIKDFQNSINEIRSNADLINFISEKTQNNISYTDDQDLGNLELYFQREEISFKGNLSIMSTINELYEDLCNIFNVSLTEYELKILKIESGTLFLNLEGHEQIIELIKTVLPFLGGYYLNKFTKQGKLETDLKNVMNALELAKMAEEVGLTFDENHKEDLEQMVGKIISSAKKIVTKGKVCINGSTIGSDDTSQKLLEDSSSTTPETTTTE